MSAPRWRPNIGSKPERSRLEIARLEEQGAVDSAFRIDKVHVRLRNGQVHRDWPTDTGRTPSTRWTIRGDSHDIIEWMEA